MYQNHSLGSPIYFIDEPFHISVSEYIESLDLNKTPSYIDYESHIAYISDSGSTIEYDGDWISTGWDSSDLNISDQKEISSEGKQSFENVGKNKTSKSLLHSYNSNNKRKNKKTTNITNTHTAEKETQPPE
eukprot:779226_1